MNEVLIREISSGTAMRITILEERRDCRYAVINARRPATVTCTLYMEDAGMTK